MIYNRLENKNLISWHQLKQKHILIDEILRKLAPEENFFNSMEVIYENPVTITVLHAVNASSSEIRTKQDMSTVTSLIQCDTGRPTHHSKTEKKVTNT